MRNGYNKLDAIGFKATTLTYRKIQFGSLLPPKLLKRRMFGLRHSGRLNSRISWK